MSGDPEDTFEDALADRFAEALMNDEDGPWLSAYVNGRPIDEVMRLATEDTDDAPHPQ